MVEMVVKLHQQLRGPDGSTDRFRKEIATWSLIKLHHVHSKFLKKVEKKEAKDARDALLFVKAKVLYKECVGGEFDRMIGGHGWSPSVDLRVGRRKARRTYLRGGRWETEKVGGKAAVVE